MHKKHQLKHIVIILFLSLILFNCSASKVINNESTDFRLYEIPKDWETEKSREKLLLHIQNT